MRPPEAAPFRLEPLTAAHADALYAAVSDPALYRDIDEPPPPSIEAFRERCRRLALGPSPERGELWINEVILTAAGDAAGYVQSTVLPARGEAWIAYMLGTAFRGQGYATRAAAQLMSRLEREHGVRRWLATVEERNAPSIAVLERLGFRLETDSAHWPREMTATERFYAR